MLEIPTVVPEYAEHFNLLFPFPRHTWHQFLLLQSFTFSSLSSLPPFSRLLPLSDGSLSAFSRRWRRRRRRRRRKLRSRWMRRRLQTKGSRQTYFLSGNRKETLNIVGHGDWLVSVRYGGSPQRGDYTLPYIELHQTALSVLSCVV